MTNTQNNIRAFLEVTGLALMLFAVPIGYYYGRDSILQVQNKIYYKFFGIRQEHLDQFKKRLAEQERQDKEAQDKLLREDLQAAKKSD